jgi:hypothetical protein
MGYYNRPSQAKKRFSCNINMRSKPLLAVRYESQVYTTIWSEQLSREERELKRDKSLNTRGKRHARAMLHVICLQFLQLRNKTKGLKQETGFIYLALSRSFY